MPGTDPNPGESAAIGSKDEYGLGEPIRVFGAKWTTRAVVALCGLVLLGGSVWLLVAMGPWGPGPWLLAFSIVIFGLAYLMGQSSYLVCPGGIIQVRLGHRRQCRWDDLSAIIDVQIKQGMVSSRRCDLIGKNGSRLALTNLGIGDFAAMIALIREQAQARGIPWKEEQQAVQ